jgi:hypothetical protein
LRRARAELRQNLTAIELACDLDIAGSAPVDEPALLRRESLGGLAGALLGAGAAMRALGPMRVRILAVCIADRCDQVRFKTG